VIHAETLGRRLERELRRFAPALAIVALTVTVFPLPGGVAVQGLILGLLDAMVAVGLALLYRANRILNFAQAELGAAPTVLAVSLVAYGGWNYFLALGVGLVGAVALGALVELALIRRFFRAPRLILTVATIGLAQLLAVGSIVIPSLWDERPTTTLIHLPVTLRFTIDPLVFSADHVLALLVAPLALTAVALALRYTDLGIAIRASAERSDRAALLGVRVKRLQTVVWALAALLSFLGVFLRAGILGLPILTTLDLSILLVALAALMLGRLTDLPVITASALALGLLEQGVTWHNPRHPELVEPILAAVIVAGLLARKLGTTRAEHDDASSWRSTDDVRPTPAALRRTPEVRAVRWGGGLLVAAVLLGLPALLGPGDEEKATALVIFCLVGVSLVVLVGWAGQVSLGQMSFVGFGAASGAYATQTWHVDLIAAVLLAGCVGAVVALVVGLPALRLRGLFLAVTTLAFAMASTSYFLNSGHFSWVPRPDRTIVRPDLLGAVDMGSQSAYYHFCLVVLGLTVVAVRGIRHSRVGRMLLALRENEAAAESFGINLTRAKLTGFALSGFVAAMAGCLLVHLLTGFSPGSYAPSESFAVFISVVVGGAGSLLGACLGALFLQGGHWFLPGPRWQALASGLGVLLVLWIVPGGLADLAYRLRDAGLRWVADRRGIAVPSLSGDPAPDPGAGPTTNGRAPVVPDIPAVAVGGGAS
jgi:branched-chain amino acid transport system permease protein